jgi:enoyl-[acyl-carrier protein] reductase II
MNSLISKLFNIKHPIVQAGMVWCSGWRLASAVSNAGCLGVLGAGSMYPEVLKNQINKCKSATSNPFGVNIPLLYPDVKLLMDIVIQEGVKIVITSAGNPELWTNYLKQHGIVVAHVVSNVRFAKKAEDAGVDAVIAEGFEAGGHNGAEENTTFCLIPMVRRAITIPLIAAGGIATGDAILAAFALGADGVQIGSRFVASLESSAHPDFKEKIKSLQEGQTVVTLKELVPVRLIKNKFYKDINAAYQHGADAYTLKNLLGKGRAKAGMFEGDLDNGELEIGQVSGLIDDIKPAAEIIKDLLLELEAAKNRITTSN